MDEWIEKIDGWFDALNKFDGWMDVQIEKKQMDGWIQKQMDG